MWMSQSWSHTIIYIYTCACTSHSLSYILSLPYTTNTYLLCTTIHDSYIETRDTHTLGVFSWDHRFIWVIFFLLYSFFFDFWFLRLLFTGYTFFRRWFFSSLVSSFVGGGEGGFAGLPLIISAVDDVDYFTDDQRRMFLVCVPWVNTPFQRSLSCIYTICRHRSYVGSDFSSNQRSPLVAAGLQDQSARILVKLRFVWCIIRMHLFLLSKKQEKL